MGVLSFSSNGFRLQPETSPQRMPISQKPEWEWRKGWDPGPPLGWWAPILYATCDHFWRSHHRRAVSMNIQATCEPWDDYPSFQVIITGWWLSHPSKKYEFVSWDDDIPNKWKNNVPNHQRVIMSTQDSPQTFWPNLKSDMLCLWIPITIYTLCFLKLW